MTPTDHIAVIAHALQIQLERPGWPDAVKATHEAITSLSALKQMQGELIQQIDISDYRDGLSHALKMNAAYIRLRGVVGCS